MAGKGGISVVSRLSAVFGLCCRSSLGLGAQEFSQVPDTSHLTFGISKEGTFIVCAGSCNVMYVSEDDASILMMIDDVSSSSPTMESIKSCSYKIRF